MDRLKIPIPRVLLDMFLDYSINNKYFEKEKDLVKEKPFNRKINKFDVPSEYQEYDFYFKQKNRFQSRVEDLNDVYKNYKSLNINAKPYLPKKISMEDKTIDKPVLNINASEYFPKTFAVVKDDDRQKEKFEKLIN